MTPSDVLRGARELLARGWSEPFALDEFGHIAVNGALPVSWSVFDALERAAAGDVDAWLVAETKLLEATRVRSTVTLGAWLETKPAHSEVLTTFQRAIFRAQQ